MLSIRTLTASARVPQPFLCKGKSKASPPEKFRALPFPSAGSQQEAIVRGSRVTLPLPVQIRDV